MNWFNILIIAAISIVCYYLPKEFSNSFRRKHGSSPISWPFAIVSAVLLLLSFILGDNNELVFWLLFCVFALFFLFVLFYCASVAARAGASVGEIILTIILQIFATAGIAIVVLLVLGSIGKKRKR